MTSFLSYCSLATSRCLRVQQLEAGVRGTEKKTGDSSGLPLLLFIWAFSYALLWLCTEPHIFSYLYFQSINKDCSCQRKVAQMKTENISNTEVTDTEKQNTLNGIGVTVIRMDTKFWSMLSGVTDQMVLGFNRLGMDTRLFSDATIQMEMDMRLFALNEISPFG